MREKLCILFALMNLNFLKAFQEVIFKLFISDRWPDIQYRWLACMRSLAPFSFSFLFSPSLLYILPTSSLYVPQADPLFSVIAQATSWSSRFRVKKTFGVTHIHQHSCFPPCLLIHENWLFPWWASSHKFHRIHCLTHLLLCPVVLYCLGKNLSPYYKVE